MKRWFLWTWKELRDYAPILLGIAVVVPVLLVIAFVAFPNAIGSARAHVLSRWVSVIVMGLFALGVASDAVGSEFRRGTIAFVRRQPRGMGLAWAGKLTALLLSAVALTFVSQAALATCFEIFSTTPFSNRQSAWVWSNLFGFTGAGWSMVLLALPLIFWPLMLGAWLGRSGAAGIAALTLLAAIGGPLYMWLTSHRWILGRAAEHLYLTLAAALAVIGLVCATFSWLRGRRHAARPWRAAILGSSALAVLLVPAIAIGAMKYSEWMHIDPNHERFRISEAYVGADESSLWLSVSKGQPYLDGRPYPRYGRNMPASRGTPLVSWRVDLSAKTIKTLNEGEEGRLALPGQTVWHRRSRQLTPARALRLSVPTNEKSDWRSQVQKWYDTLADQCVATLAINTRDGNVDRLQQAALKRSAWQRDSEGNRVWIRDGALEREGHEQAPSARAYVPPRQNLRGILLAALPCGAFSKHAREIVSADGHSRTARRDLDRHSASMRQLLSPDLLLTRHHVLRPGEKRRRDTPGVLGLHHTMDGSMSRDVAMPNDSKTDWEIVGEESVLCFGPTESSEASSQPTSKLVLWNPVTGATTSLNWTEAHKVDSIHSFSVLGRNGEGQVLLSLAPRANMAWHETAFVLVVLDVEARTLRVVNTHYSSYRNRPIAMLEDGAVVVIKHANRIVRLGPEPRRERQLFPIK